MVKPQNERDHYSLRYAEFVVPLVKAMQEQQEIMEQQEDRLKKQEEKLEALKTTNEKLETRLENLENLISQLTTNPQQTTTATITLTDTDLLQNQPNPFYEATTIQYFVPETAKTAELQITRLDGRLVQTIPIVTKGKGQIRLQAQRLSTGTYFYSLLIDKEIKNTKKMVLTKN